MITLHRPVARFFAAGFLVATFGLTPPSRAAVSTFSGGDLGEGLDLTGTFASGYAVYAGPASETATYQIQDAVFENSLVAGGIDITGSNETVFGNPSYGGTANDANLTNITNFVRFGGAGTPSGTVGVSITAPVVTGAAYRLQLLFNEACCGNRGFDVYAEGNLVDANFNPSVTQGHADGSAPGALVTYDFTAGDNLMTVELRTSIPAFGDSNAIIDAVSLETLPEPTSLSLIGLAAIGLVRRRTRFA